MTADRVVADDGDDEGACEWCSEVGQLFVIGVLTDYKVRMVDGTWRHDEADTWLCKRCAEGYVREKEEKAERA